MKAWMSSNFGKFATELLPFIDVRIKFLLNILKKNRPIKDTRFSLYGLGGLPSLLQINSPDIIAKSKAYLILVIIWSLEQP